MKKLLIGSVVAVLFMGAPVVYADDAHHPEQGGVPAAKPAAGKNVLSNQPAAPDKSMSNAEGSGVADAQMGKAQERMQQTQALMAKLRETKDAAERQRLMREHMQAMRDTMGMMRGMKMGMDGCQGMGMMGSGQGMGMMGQGKGHAQTGGMMPMHRMMERRMEMMQMMMEQMLDRQEMLMQDGK